MRKLKFWDALLEDLDLNPTAKLVGWVLVDQFNYDRGYSFPSHEWIADRLSISRRSSIRAVRTLIRLRWFKYRRGGGRREFGTKGHANEYVPCWERMPPQPNGDKLAPLNTPTSAVSGPNATIHGDKSGIDNRANLAPQSSYLNPLINPIDGHASAKNASVVGELILEGPKNGTTASSAGRNKPNTVADWVRWFSSKEPDNPKIHFLIGSALGTPKVKHLHKAWELDVREPVKFVEDLIESNDRE